VCCAGSAAEHAPIPFRGVHHVGLLVEDLGRSLEFYRNTLGAGCHAAPACHVALVGVQCRRCQHQLRRYHNRISVLLETDTITPSVLAERSATMLPA